VKNSRKKEKLPFNAQTNMNMKKSIELNLKLNMKMNGKKIAKMKLNTMLHMGNPAIVVLWKQSNYQMCGCAQVHI
jgi:hypothetical protein